MEFRDAKRIFLKHKTLTIGLIMVVMVGAYLWQYLQPVQYVTSMSFAVNRVSKQQTTEYQYDGYYAIQAADLFSQTLVSWLQTPSVLVEIYSKAGIQTNDSSFRSLTSRFKTKKYSSQNVVVTYSASSEEQATKLGSALSDVVQQKTESANTTPDSQSLFQIAASKPVIIRSTPDPILIGAASFVVGVALALFLVPFAAYVAASSRPI
jgi:capsular polysaccharide biosynthesis protein